jgi:hypothetical protein
MPVPQGVGQAVKLAGVEAGIGEQDFQGADGCRVVLEASLNVSLDVPDER